ncbi:MAG: IPT/TIG domain-containing protein, partial [Methanoregula sp.]|uniref:IPT/TIG domain-containing protein n=1 Tax=Methanoregula sp. TaxID=2052170 RepID=UPI003C3C7D54
MVKPTRHFACRIIFILCIVVIVAGIGMPVYAGTSITDSLSISAVQGNVTSISNTSGEHRGTHTAMQFTKDQLDEMQNEINAAPKYSAPQQLFTAIQSSLPSSMSLLSYLPYTPSQRDQGSCGNCWVWASTGALEIGHNINSGISDRLSIQYFDSKYQYNTGIYACGGGNPITFANWYNSDKTPIPWTNTNAAYGDYYSTGGTAVPFSSISTVPYYKLNSLSSSVIPTDGVGQAAAINNIKSALNSNQPVVYSFRLPGVGSTTFDNFWDNYPEMSYVYDPSVYNDYMLDNPAWAHAVLIVGYDNSADTSIPYWIVVNSWGAPSNRLDGLFLLNMTMNYNAVVYPYGDTTDPLQQNTFQILNPLFTPPTVTGISPTAGPIVGGTTVTITGININGATTVKFGTTAATLYTVNSANSITATAPAGSAGSVDITITTRGGTSAKSSADQYTFAAFPTITGISPTAGPIVGGTSLTITGTSFTGATSVTIGGKPASSFKVTSATTITATAPAGSVGAVDVTVTAPGGTATGTGAYTYAAVPTVTGISPAAGPTVGGTSVTITGTSLTGATAVSFGGAAATQVTVVNATAVTATTPAHAAGTVDITVTTPGGTSAKSSADQYTYAAAPTVTSLSPAAGPIAGGTNITITGTALTGATAVSFGVTAATSFVVVNATTITAIAPAVIAGIVDVTVTTPGGISTAVLHDKYMYQAVSTVTGISPVAGPLTGGTIVTITGTAFTGASGVTFGSTAATHVTVVNATAVTATVPANTTAGTVDVTITTPGGTSAVVPADQFTYQAPPTVTGISPAAGPIAGGTVVTVTGTVLTGATAVTFGSTAATHMTFVNATTITATTPAHAAGTVDVTITTPGGTSQKLSADQYTYVAPPAVTAVAPAATPWYRNATVPFLLTGTNFAPGQTTVTFSYPSNGTALNPAGFTVNTVTATTINGTVVVPLNAPTGTWNVSVTTLYGGQVWKAAAFSVSNFPAPTITSVTYPPGNIGTTVLFTITGT